MADPEKVYYAYLLYGRYLALLDEVFSGYLLSVPESVRIGYLELCDRLEGLFGQLAYDIDWKPFDSLFDLDEESDIDWEYRRREVTIALAFLERQWASAGQPKPNLENDDTTFLSKTDSFREAYKQYKKELDKKFESRVETLAKSLQSRSDVRKPSFDSQSSISRLASRLKPDEVNLGIPGIASVTYRLGKKDDDEVSHGENSNTGSLSY